MKTLFFSTVIFCQKDFYDASHPSLPQLCTHVISITSIFHEIFALFRRRDAIKKMWHNFSQMRSRARRFDFLARNYLRWREKNVIRNSRQHDDAAALARHSEWMKWSESIKNVLNEIQPSINNVTSRQFYDPRIFVFSHSLTFFSFIQLSAELRSLNFALCKMNYEPFPLSWLSSTSTIKLEN